MRGIRTTSKKVSEWHPSFLQYSLVALKSSIFVAIFVASFVASVCFCADKPLCFSVAQMMQIFSTYSAMLALRPRGGHHY